MFFLLGAPLGPQSLPKNISFHNENLGFKARIRKKERKKEDIADRNKSPSTVVRTKHFCYARAWKPLTPTYNGYTLTSFTARQRMVAERTAVRFEKEQDARKYMTKDAGERSSRIPGWDREADAYFSCARRARQDVERT